MSRTTTKELTVILEADPDDEGSFSIERVNGMTQDEVNKVPPRMTPEQHRELEVKGNVFLEIPRREVTEVLTDEQVLLDLFDNCGTDIFWPHDEPPDMKGKPYIKLVGHVWFEEYDSIDYGKDYDSGFDVDSEELLEELP